jgi:hypothetical protein
MFITLILIIVFIILLSCNNCSGVEQLDNDEVYNLYTDADFYRIGDLVRGITHVKNYNSNLDLVSDTLLKFPNSIASEYIRNIDPSSLHKISNLNINKELYLYKISVIKDLLKRYNIPQSNGVVVHLRVGDILDHASQNPPSKKQLYNYINKNIKLGRIYEKYVKRLSYYHNLIHELKKNNIKKVTIIAGSHVKCPNYKVSSYYINIIKKLFEENGLEVTLRAGLHPDEDLKLAVGSKKFYGSGGGYSELLELLNNST